MIRVLDRREGMDITRILFKCCPKCKEGDMYLNGDNELTCIQCGLLKFPNVDRTGFETPLIRVREHYSVH